MYKNYMKDVADMLGIHLDEEFYMQHTEENEVPTYAYYKLTHNGLYECINNKWEYCYVLPLLLRGEYRIVKKPFIPKTGDKYYYISFDEYLVDVIATRHYNTEYDCIRTKAGIVYSTHKECKDNLEKDYKLLTGKDIQDDYEYINYKWLRKIK